MWILQPLISNIYKFITSDLPADFFSNQFISSSLDFMQWFGTVIFAFSFLLLISSAVEAKAAGEYVSIKTIALNALKGFCLLEFARPLVIWAFQFAQNAVNCLLYYVSKVIVLPKVSAPATTDSTSNPIFSALFGAVMPKGVANTAQDILKAIGQASWLSGNLSIITIIQFVTTIAVFFQILTLYAMLYIQIVTGYLNIADVMSGNVSAVEDWLRDIVASCITFFCEYLFYVMGFAMLAATSYDDLAKCAPGLVLIIGAPAIPAALRKWGYSHGSGSARGVVAGLGNAVTGTVQAFTHL